MWGAGREGVVGGGERKSRNLSIAVGAGFGSVPLN